MLDRAISSDNITCDNECGASYRFGDHWLAKDWRMCEHILCPKCAEEFPCNFCGEIIMSIEVGNNDKSTR